MGSACRVLVVDDDPDVREIMTEVLSCEGYDVSSADSALQALTCLSKAPQPCILLLDVMMPGMTGLDLAERLLEDRGLASIPVCFVTAAPASVRQHQRAVSTWSVLPKPVDLKQLLTVIKQA